MIEKELVSNFKSSITSAHNICIIPHLSPDGDAMGSCLGMQHVLNNMEKKVTVVIPTAYPKFLAWLKGTDTVVNFEDDNSKVITILNEVDLVIYMDFNCYKRTGDMEKLLSVSTVPSVMIDHHPGPDEIADVLISKPKLSSTCELSCILLKQAGLMEYVNSNAAECFYTGIITDTGSLSYNSSNSYTYKVVADLLDIGIDKDKIHQLLFKSNSYNRMRLLGYVLSEKMMLLPEQEAAFVCLDKNELEKYNYQTGDTEGFVNYPLSIEGINISAFFAEKDDKIKCSFRSNGDFPVNDFSNKYFNGGGHKNAAGGICNLDMESALSYFKKVFVEYYAEYKIK